MCIDVNDLNTKILKDSPNDLMFFQNFIDFMIELKAPVKYKKPGHPNNDQNDEYLNKEIFNFTKKYNIAEGSNTELIFDNLRHAFMSYKSGGLLNLFKHREAESWYPKVIIRDIIYPHHINTLDKEIQIFRGTSKKEYISQKFSQAWTIDKKIAEKFAFLHYADQTDYQDTSRVILETKINKENIYYFSLDDDENEIIVDERKIIYQNVKIIKEKIL